MDFSLMFLIFAESPIVSLSTGVSEEMWTDRFQGEFSRYCEISRLVIRGEVHESEFTAWKDDSEGREISSSV